MSKFQEWAEQELYENNHDLQPDEAGAMGWYACKEEILKYLKEIVDSEIIEYVEHELIKNIEEKF